MDIHLTDDFQRTKNRTQLRMRFVLIRWTHAVCHFSLFHKATSIILNQIPRKATICKLI